MDMYNKPSAELITFDNSILGTVAEGSGTCRCYLDIGVKSDYGAAETECWSDSEDATAYDMHDAPL